MSVESSIKEYQLFLDKFTDYYKELYERSDKRKLEDFQKLRGFSLDIIKECGIFYVGDSTEMLIPAYLKDLISFGVIAEFNKRPIFHDRYIIPIKDTSGRILNFVGYSNLEKERYIYGTSVYYRRASTLYGLENLHKAYKDGYGIAVEGITDAIRVRDLGFDNCFAWCGTRTSQFSFDQLNRMRYGIVSIPDRDRAGVEAAKSRRFNRMVSLNTFVKYKDIDEMCKDEENIEKVKAYIQMSIDILKNGENRGFIGEHKIITMF